MFQEVFKKLTKDTMSEEQPKEILNTDEPEEISTYHDVEGYCQLSHQTKEERFPKIFDNLVKLKPKAKRILSFGCSSGEECFSLAKRFPEAEIIGLDLDYYSIKRARGNNKFKDRIYFHTEIGGTGKYDIVTALMALFGLSQPVSKENWINAIGQIDKHLNPYGVFALYTSEYSFGETEIANNYKTIKQWKRRHPRNKKLYSCGYYQKRTEDASLYLRDIKARSSKKPFA